MPSIRIDLGTHADLIARLHGLFVAKGVRAWATGGFLRDAILGEDPHDIDIAVEGDPLTLGPAIATEFGGHFFPLKEERGQARVLFADQHTYLDLMPLRAPDIEADLRLRDYTIDALAAPLVDLTTGAVGLIDPMGGMTDLDANLVRMTSELALLDDPLRMLRGVRIATELKFAVEEATAEAIRRHASKIADAAAERQRDEIIRIFATEQAGSGVRLLDELGLFAHVFPEMEATRDAEQPKEHYHDVLGHSLAAVQALDCLMAEAQPADVPWDELWRELWTQLAWCDGLHEYFAEEIVPSTSHKTLLKFCGLLHDIAKPQTRSFEADGRMRFFGHSEQGAELATQLMRRLRFSSRETSMVAAMIDAHLRPVQLGQRGAPSKRAVYKFFRDTGDAGIDTLFLSLADHLATVGPRMNLEGFRAHVALTSYILHVRYTETEVIRPPKLVDGDVLMAALDLEPGPILGDLLEAVREGQAAGEVDSVEQAVDLARRRLAEVRMADRE